jgi:hypothetical protein
VKKQGQSCLHFILVKCGINLSKLDSYISLT